MIVILFAKICEEPYLKCKQGDILLNILKSIENRYDISIDNLIESLTSFSNFKELNTHFKKCYKKDNKKQVKKAAKFIPMEDGKVLKLPKIHNYFHSKLKITEEDRKIVIILKMVDLIK